MPSRQPRGRFEMRKPIAYSHTNFRETQQMIEEAMTRPILLNPADDDREMVPGLRITVQIHRADGIGLAAEASILMSPPDRAPFNRINEQLRRQLHDDMDRLMNDINRIWNKTFRASPSNWTHGPLPDATGDAGDSED